MKYNGNDPPPKKMIFQHFILTLFNVDDLTGPQSSLKLDKSWLKHRFKLFNKFCYPSVRGQSNQNFKWIILFDINTPDVFKRRISKYSKWENFISIYINKRDRNSFREVILRHLKDETEYLVTTRLDNDDAICKDFVEVLQNYFDKQKIQFLNFTNGYVWKNNEIYLFKQPSNPFVSLIEKIDDSSFRTVFTGEGHHKLYKVGPVMEIITKPAWMQVIHTKNRANSVKGMLQTQKKVRYLGGDFEIRKNLFFSYWIGSGFYFFRQMLDRTRKTRHSLGLTANQFMQYKKKLAETFQKTPRQI